MSYSSVVVQVGNQGKFPRRSGGEGHFSDAFTTMTPLIDFPWTLQWYLNSPSFSNVTGLDDLPGSTSSVSNVFPSSSDVAVCVVRDELVHTTESPTWISSFLG